MWAAGWASVAFPIHPFEAGTTLTQSRRVHPAWWLLSIPAGLLAWVLGRQDWGSEWLQRARRCNHAGFAAEVSDLLQRAGYTVHSVAADDDGGMVLAEGLEGSLAISCWDLAAGGPPTARGEVAVVNAATSGSDGWQGAEAFLSAVEAARKARALGRVIRATPA